MKTQITPSAGGDDYMTKPFMAGELIARIKAHLRRQSTLMKESAQHLDNVYDFGDLDFGDLKIDFDTHECTAYGKEVSFTSKEFKILKLLVENPRKVFPATQIFETVWKTNCMKNDAKTVMVYISTLRKKN
ncbi:MAG: response regulator transcription factor [Lentihominibacter sp.]|jgi:DNA-binding response OmpR family regulator